MIKVKIEDYMVKCLSSGGDNGMQILKNFEEPTIEDLLFIKDCVESQIKKYHQSGNLYNGFSHLYKEVQNLRKLQFKKKFKKEKNEIKKNLKYGFLLNKEFEYNDCFFGNKTDSGYYYMGIDKNKFEQNLVKFDFDYTCLNSGIYLIDDFYVGKSGKVKKRFYSHIADTINGRHFNKSFEAKVIEKFSSGRPLEVKIICNDLNMENEMIVSYIADGYPLTNKRIINP